MGSGSTTTIATRHSTSPLGEGGDGKVSIEEISAALNGTKQSSIKRFSQIHTIGLGGIGTVMSAYEPQLDRDLAIKMLRPAYRDNRNSINRFIQEARATAHVAHPNIVPVYELGIFKEIGPFFTMKRVEGVTLQHVLKRLDENEEKYVKKYTLRELLNVFISICHGVAYAHSKNIIHRDLKPANIMLGDYGEVMVMDWGLVKKADHATRKTKTPPVLLANTEEESLRTIDGEVTGTPAFMSPEQACGHNDAVDIQSDIYCLGAVLYTILTRQRSPFPSGLNTREILQLCAEGKIISPRKRMPKLKIPKELNAITMKAMSLEKKQRYATVLELLHDVRSYLDHYPVSAYSDPLHISFIKACKRRPMIPTTVAAAIITLAIAFGFQIYDRNERFNYYLKQANENILSGDMMYSRGKSVIKRLTELRQTGNIADENKIIELNKQLDKFNTSLNNYYNVAEGFLGKIDIAGARLKMVNSKLGYIMKNKIYYSLLAGDYQTTKRLIELMRLNRRPESYQMVRQNATLYKKMNLVYYNEGTINIETVPIKSQVKLTELPDEQMVSDSMDETESKLLGTAPIENITVTAGSYLISMQNKRSNMISYPLLVEPGDIIHQQIYIPATIPKDMVYIPAGNYYTGATAQERRKKYLSGFFIKKHEVTFAEYLRFWKKLRDPDKKQRYRSMLLLDQNSRRLAPAWDNNLKLCPQLKPEYPVSGISHEAAEAYCRWISSQRHRSCMLPSAEQWEKAARGVDGRKYIWGNYLQNKNALIPENNFAAKKYPFGAPAEKFSLDRSIYGVYEMAGNVREYTATPNNNSKLTFIVKGGSSRIGGDSLYCSFNGFAGRLADDIGFRYIMPLTSNSQQNYRHSKIVNSAKK
jgi:serine/threonine protein kinase/formylglycine-generating enzyme required for sulfatase activity